MNGAAPHRPQMLNWKKTSHWVFYKIATGAGHPVQRQVGVQKMQRVHGVWKTNHIHISMVDMLRKPRDLHTDSQDAAGPAAFNIRKGL